ncbi:MAG: hypothetical protein CM15mP23_09560 [Cryomorphaceae bacterium]|nr:MAG: hypothetical protein CM15mP23_09560 [Cryomorphaceae bacterium]
MDSLKLVIEERIADASIKPEGLGRQFKMPNLCTKQKKLLMGISTI